MSIGNIRVALELATTADMGLYRHIGRPLGTVDQVSVVTVWYIKRYEFDEETFKHISKLYDNYLSC